MKPLQHARPERRILAVAVIAVLAAGSFGYAATRYRGDRPTSTMRPTGIPAAVSTPLANLMALSPIPGRSAPDFTLTDQNGKEVSMASFRGRAVVLEFTDPHCTDVCPIVSEELVDAYRDLGRSGANAVFISVNVNVRSVEAMMTYTKAHQLDTVPTWHFVTGSVGDLKRVWHSYDVEV
jgi:cytochrome oxidase Cu insertion factor (SCO1/SenC/PrrC family)